MVLLLSRISCLLFLISSGLDSAGGITSFAAYTINGTSDGFDSLITSCFYPSLLTFDLFSLFFASICPSFLFEASFSMFFWTNLSSYRLTASIFSCGRWRYSFISFAIFSGLSRSTSYLKSISYFLSPNLNFMKNFKMFDFDFCSCSPTFADFFSLMPSFLLQFIDDVVEASFLELSFGFMLASLAYPAGTEAAGYSSIFVYFIFFVAFDCFSIFFISSFGFSALISLFWLSPSFMTFVCGTCMTRSEDWARLCDCDWDQRDWEAPCWDWSSSCFAGRALSRVSLSFSAESFLVFSIWCSGTMASRPSWSGYYTESVYRSMTGFWGSPMF